MLLIPAAQTHNTEEPEFDDNDGLVEVLVVFENASQELYDLVSAKLIKDLGEDSVSYNPYCLELSTPDSVIIPLSAHPDQSVYGQDSNHDERDTGQEGLHLACPF